jgi:hypothetical protein
MDGEGWIQCCSVNRSTFSNEGTLESGPAEGPVKSYNVTVADGRAVIDVDVN